MTQNTKMSICQLDLLVGFQYWKNCVPHTAANLWRVHRAFIVLTVLQFALTDKP